MAEAALPAPIQPPRRAGSLKKFIGLIVLVVVVALVLIFGYRYWHYASIHETTDDAFVDGDITQVSPLVSGQVVKLYVRDNQLVKAGDPIIDIDPRDYQERVAHQKALLLAAEDRVQSAQVQVRLTNVTSGANVQQAQGAQQAAASAVQQAQSNVSAFRSQVDVARARLAQAEAAVISSERKYAQDRAMVPASQAEVARTTADVKRYEMLYARDEVSRQQLDNALAAEREAHAQLKSAISKASASENAVNEARANVASAQAAVAQAEAQVAEAQSHIGQAQAQVTTARGQMAAANAAPVQVEASRQQLITASADVRQARADLAQAELNLSYTHLRAPIAGRVTKRAVDVGNYVAPGQALMALVPVHVWITANYKETQLDRMRVGQPVDIRVDAFPGIQFKGKVDSFQAGTGARFSVMPPENASGNYVKVVQRVPVKIVFDEPDDKLQMLGPGMSCEPAVDISSQP
jgi:membrane fusion protein (multidrug efflux system)